MSRKCDLFFKGVMSGNHVAHSNVKVRRKFRPNLQKISFFSNLLKESVSFKLCRSAVRTVDKYGGIDDFFLNFRSNKLTPLGQKYKRKFIKAMHISRRKAKEESTAV